MPNESFPSATPNKVERASPEVEARRSRDENRKDFFNLQYAAAEIIGEKLNIPFEDALFRFTTLSKEFGLADASGKTDALNPIWQRYVAGLKEHRDDPAGYTYQFSLELPPKVPKSEKQRFGCFNFKVPDEEGTVSIHFTNADTDSQSPLSGAKVEKRKAELREMFAYIKQTYPNVKTVEGGSWLYDLEAYRRLFPPSFGDSREPAVQNERIQHSGYWGQFLDRNGSVRLEAAQQFLDRLKHIDQGHVGEAFEHVPYRTKAPIQEFYDFYGIV